MISWKSQGKHCRMSMTLPGIQKNELSGDRDVEFTAFFGKF